VTQMRTINVKVAYFVNAIDIRKSFWPMNVI